MRSRRKRLLVLRSSRFCSLLFASLKSLSRKIRENMVYMGVICKCTHVRLRRAANTTGCTRKNHRIHHPVPFSYMLIRAAFASEWDLDVLGVAGRATRQHGSMKRAP
eukprot:6474909-Amphidinium_carterae.2